ncbi:MAG: hypothetical protein FWB80_06270 [Defluviitaleaceae bacterium]|nr:hypothetical protein [Defluviitaleaceae bacterium]
MKLRILLIFIFLTACGNSDEGGSSTSPEDYEGRYGYINELRAEIEYNKKLVESLGQELTRVQFENRRLEARISDFQRPRAFPHGLNEDEIRESFFAYFDSDEFNTHKQEKLGLNIRSGDLNEITLNIHYLIAQENSWMGLYFFFAYTVWEGEITWHWLGYDVHWLPWLPMRFTTVRELPTPRRLTGLPYVTVRFHHFPDSPPYDDVTAHYTQETIRGAYLWAETIRLAQEHNGVLIRDLWYEGSTLYVDLKLAMLFAFRVGLGSITAAEAMIETFYSFPGVTNVVFLLDGKEMPGIYNDWCVNTRTFPWWEEWYYREY